MAAHWVDATANADPPDVEPLVSVRGHSPPPVPGRKDVRYVKREMTRLVNQMPQIRVEVAETRALLEHATTVLRDASDDFKELLKVHRTLEYNVIEQYKNDYKLWDGTYVMPEEHMGQWDQYVQEMQDADEEKTRLERKAREAEMEELMRQQDL